MLSVRAKAVRKFKSILIKNYVKATQKAWVDPQDEDYRKIEAELKKLGIECKDYYIDSVKYSQFKDIFPFGKDFKFYGNSGPLFEEKVLEHYIAMQLLDLKKEMNYVDVAACNSPWVHYLHKSGYKATAIDLVKSKVFQNEVNYQVMDATQTSFKDRSVDAVSLQCAFEMFEGDDDIKLIRELDRILSDEGVAIILPLYLNDHYSGYSSYDRIKRSQDKYPDIKIYYREYNNINLARFYSVTAFNERVVAEIKKRGLKFELQVVRNKDVVDPSLYIYFMLTIRR